MISKIRSYALSILTLLTLLTPTIVPAVAGASCSTTANNIASGANAATGSNSIGCGSSGVNNSSVGKAAKTIVTLFSVIVGAVSIIMIIYGGFRYITSGGDQKKIESAVASINMSLFGLIIMVAAAALTGIVSYLLFGSATAILSPKIIGPGSTH